jgi:hypothetical protein
MQITIATFDDPPSAEKLRARFQEEGLSPEIYDERKLQKYWFLNQPRAGIRVKVPNEEYEQAEKLYQELDTADDPVLRAAVRCPQCRSSRIQYPQMTRHFILPTLLGHLTFILGLRRTFYCQHCQYTWSQKGKTTPPVMPSTAHTS